MNEESFVPLYTWDGVYEISDLGRIKRIKKNRCKLGFLSFNTHQKYGYQYVHLRDKDRDEVHFVHRLVLLSFMGTPPEGKEIVNHKNGIRNDNKLSNLEWCNHSENNHHAYKVLNRDKICMKGSANGRSKLSDNDIFNIRERYKLGDISQQSLANEFGVTQNMISKIVLRQFWTHI